MKNAGCKCLYTFIRCFVCPNFPRLGCCVSAKFLHTGACHDSPYSSVCPHLMQAAQFVLVMHQALRYFELGKMKEYFKVSASRMTLTLHI